MTMRVQNFRQSECFRLATTTASSVPMNFTQNAPPNNPLAAMRLVNNATGTAYFALARGTATATVPTAGTSSPMIPVGAGGDVVVDMDPGVNSVAAILLAGTGDCHACPGEGS